MVRALRARLDRSMLPARGSRARSAQPTLRPDQAAASFGVSDPTRMMATPDPIGPENDAALLAAANRCEKIIAAWGVRGAYQNRAQAVVRLLASREWWCLGATQDGCPRHPLYVDARQPFIRSAPNRPDPTPSPPKPRTAPAAQVSPATSPPRQNSPTFLNHQPACRSRSHRL